MAKQGASFMNNFHFILNNENQLSLSSTPPSTKLNSFKVNVIGDYLKEQRLKNNLTKLDVARKLGFHNLSKTVIHLTDIEDNSMSFEGYNTRLIEFYIALNKDIRSVGQILLILKEKEKQEYIRLRKVKTEFYLSVIKNLPLLYKNIDKIMNSEKYYFCPASDSYFISGIVGRGRNELYLGELLQLWKDDKWKSECPKCGGTIYITNAGGSALSGSGSASGICKDCKEIIYGITPFGKYFREILELPKRKIPEDLKYISFETMLTLIKK